MCIYIEGEDSSAQLAYMEKASYLGKVHIHAVVEDFGGDQLDNNLLSACSPWSTPSQCMRLRACMAG